jgi:UDPglucose 6-dehydrogenase
MNIAVMGTGHVGLVSCVALARMGHEVVGFDVDEEKVSLLQRGVTPFHEPDLDAALHSELDGGRVRFTARASDALARASVVFICVGTPMGEDGEAKLHAMEEAASQIARDAIDGVLVVEKSTVPAGTAERVRTVISLEAPNLDFDVASNPEFLREGHALHDALFPDRIVVGVSSEVAASILRRVYEPITSNGALLIETDVRTAELAKHASNAFLAMKISYANALARLSERLGADVRDVIEVLGADPRIGAAFLGAGLGYGGYCLPKDVLGLERLSARVGYDFGLLREVDRVNREAMEATVEKIEDALWNLQGKRICILGLAFKAGTDDARLSPAVELARRLRDLGASVVAYDPMASANAQHELPELDIAPDPYVAAIGAHCVVIATEWAEFRHLDLKALREAVATPILVDARNVLREDQGWAAGFAYYSMGRRPLQQHPGASDLFVLPEPAPLDAVADAAG